MLKSAAAVHVHSTAVVVSVCNKISVSPRADPKSK